MTTQSSHPGRDYVKDVIRNEPNRIKYELSVKNHPHFARVFMDGAYTRYAKCTLCRNHPYLIQYTIKSGSFALKAHTEKHHPNFDYEEYRRTHPGHGTAIEYKAEPNDSDSDSSDDGDGAPQRVYSASSKYPAKTQEEILAALEEIAAKEQEQEKTDPAMKDPTWKNPTWNYFKRIGESETGNLRFACQFCVFEGVKNVSIFKGHILYSCAGCPQEIRDSLKSTLGSSKIAYKYDTASKGKKSKTADKSFTGPSGVVGVGQRKSPREAKRSRYSDDLYSVGNSTRDIDSDDNYRAETDDKDGETDQIVTILNKLLGTQTPAQSEPRPVTPKEKQVYETRKTPQELAFDREVRELTIKKMRAELKDLEERTNHTRTLRLESEERTRIFKKINIDFDKLIKFINLLVNCEGQERKDLIGSVVGRLTNGGGLSFPNLLEEAFAETISGGL